MEKNEKNVRVTRTTDRRSPRGVRRLGQALIALAQAQAEAEAQAQAEAAARTASQDRRRPADVVTDDKAENPAGDAG